MKNKGLFVAATLFLCFGLGTILAVSLPYIASALSTAKINEAFVLEASDKISSHNEEKGPDQESTANETYDTELESGSLFPTIDWIALKAENADTIGWVYVPGTNISYPIVAASTSAPQFYLEHDFYGNWNYAGTPYLDSSCAENWSSYNSIVFGHSLIDQTMFSAFKHYSDESFFNEHRTIYLLTPTQNMCLTAVAANVIDGNTEAKRTQFANYEQFLSYWNGQLSDSEVVANNAPQNPEKVICFVTCSYQTDNSRTLVYAAVDELIAHD